MASTETFPFFIDLCESKLIPSRSSLKHWKITKLAELCYLYFLGLRILLANHDTKDWARHYCQRAGEPNSFDAWRTDGNDLYVMLYALSGDAEDAVIDDHAFGKLQISPKIIRHWLRHIATHDDDEATHRLFSRLDSMFHIDQGSLRSLRRTVTHWGKATARERHEVLAKLEQIIHSLASSNSELLPQLKKLDETASGGATGSASVATAVGGLGAGFDDDGDWRSIYGSRKPKDDKKKPMILHR